MQSPMHCLWYLLNLDYRGPSWVCADLKYRGSIDVVHRCGTYSCLVDVGKKFGKRKNKRGMMSCSHMRSHVTPNAETNLSRKTYKLCR